MKINLGAFMNSICCHSMRTIEKLVSKEKFVLFAKEEGGDDRRVIATTTCLSYY